MKYTKFHWALRRILRRKNLQRKKWFKHKIIFTHLAKVHTTMKIIILVSYLEDKIY